MDWFRSASSRLAFVGSGFVGSALVAPLLVGLTVSVVSAQDVDSAGEAAMLNAINARRAALGAAPLQRDARLDAAARAHSAEMSERDVLEHVSETSGTPADRADAAGVESDDIAENVAMHGDAASAQQSLEQSEAHLANMVNVAYNSVGIGAIRNARGVWVTQLFAQIDLAAPAAQAQMAVPAPLQPLQPLPPPMVQPRVGSPRVTAPVAPVAPHGGVAVITQPGRAPGAVIATIPPASRPTVMVPGATPGHQPTGYWVCSQGRWWYYPMPVGTAPGSQLQADLSVHGSPPGYPPGACVAGAQVIGPPPTRVLAAPPPRLAPAPIVVRPPVYQPRFRRRHQRWRGRGYTIVRPSPGAVVVP